jgi:conjugative transposon TraK protein
VFTAAKHIDLAFRQTRNFSLSLIGACTLISLFSIYAARKTIRESQQRIYILAGSRALEAFAATREDNLPVEAKDHIRNFHYYFFTLDPDEKVIRENISKSLYLADASAKKQYDNLRENGYYTNLIAANISQQIEGDSIRLDIDSYPIHFRYMATEKLLRASSVLTRSLVTEGWLRNVERSDNNSHGFLIERWTILENKDIKTEAR